MIESNSIFIDTSQSERNDDDEEECEDQHDLAELVVTLDPLTTGFLQDLQLIIQLAFDKCSYKIKVGVQRACDFAVMATTQMSLRDVLLNSSGERGQICKRAALLVTDTLS